MMVKDLCHISPLSVVKIVHIFFMPTYVFIFCSCVEETLFMELVSSGIWILYISVTMAYNLKGHWLFRPLDHSLIRFSQWVQGLHLITGLVKYGVNTTPLIRNIGLGSMGKRRQRQESRQSSKQSAFEKKTSKKVQNMRKSKQKSETTWIKSETSTKEPDKCSLSKLQQAMRKRLDGSRFRMLNEELYTKTGDDAFQTFQDDPELFDIVCT